MTARIACLALLLACRRTPSSPDAAPAPPQIASAPASAVSPIATSSARAPARPASARELVASWNAAINARDLRSLASFYASDVVYYGTHLAGPECVARIAAALARDPAFHQDVRVTYEDYPHHADSRAFVRLEKNDGKKTYDAYLGLDEHGLIAVESDRTTDETLVKTGKCFDYDGRVTLVGKIVKNDHLIHDHVYPEHDLELDHAVCTLDTKFEMSPKDEDGDHPQPVRVDATAVNLRESEDAGVPEALVGKRVAATGGFEEHATEDDCDEHFRVDAIVAR